MEYNLKIIFCHDVLHFSGKLLRASANMSKVLGTKQWNDNLLCWSTVLLRTTEKLTSNCNFLPGIKGHEETFLMDRFFNLNMNIPNILSLTAINTFIRNCRSDWSEPQTQLRLQIKVITLYNERLWFQFQALSPDPQLKLRTQMHLKCNRKLTCWHVSVHLSFYFLSPF